VKQSFRSNASSNVNAPTTIRGRLPHTWTSGWPVKMDSCFAVSIFQDSFQCLAVLGVGVLAVNPIIESGNREQLLTTANWEQIQERFEFSVSRQFPLPERLGKSASSLAHADWF
jgi:hypothetical protein